MDQGSDYLKQTSEKENELGGNQQRERVKITVKSRRRGSNDVTPVGCKENQFSG